MFFKPFEIGDRVRFHLDNGDTAVGHIQSVKEVGSSAAIYTVYQSSLDELFFLSETEVFVGLNQMNPNVNWKEKALKEALLKPGQKAKVSSKYVTGMDSSGQMMKYADKIVTIKHYDYWFLSAWGYIIEEDKGLWLWTEEMLSPIIPKREKYDNSLPQI